MADFEEGLNALLSNPEMMEQIMSLAKSFGSNTPEDAPPSSAPEESSGGFQASQLGDLLSGFDLGGFDPSMLGMVSTLMQEYGKRDADAKNLALIEALRPFLKEKRQAQIDRAVKLARFARLARVAFRTMKGGEGLV